MKKKDKQAADRGPRAIDHIVMPTEDLTVARARLSRLGFTVAGDARHPFGTENACVYLADGTYLEPLAVAQREECEAAAIDGNVFIARDQAWRFRNGEEGGSAIAFATQDAKADRKFFKKRGWSAGKLLRFSRRFAEAGSDAKAGKSAKAKFALAFSGDLRAPDTFLFTCQRINMPAMDRASLTGHANGVTALRRVVFSEPNASDFQYWLQDVMNQRKVGAHSFGIELVASNAVVAVKSPAGMRAWYGVDAPAERGLRMAALVFGVADLEALKALLAENGVDTREQAGRVIVDAAPGQGLLFAFEEVQ